MSTPTQTPVKKELSQNSLPLNADILGIPQKDLETSLRFGQISGEISNRHSNGAVNLEDFFGNDVLVLVSQADKVVVPAVRNYAEQSGTPEGAVWKTLYIAYRRPVAESSRQTPRPGYQRLQPQLQGSN